MSGRSRESGIGLVEVLIAGMLLTVIIAGGVLVTASSGQALRRSDMQRMRAEVARAAVQLLSEQQSWGQDNAVCRASSQPGNPACDVSSYLCDQKWRDQDVGSQAIQFRVPGCPGYSVPAGSYPSYAITVSAKGVDSPIDGEAGGDRDHRVPDWFELHVVVTGGSSADTPYVLDASTDSATRGTGGMLMIRTCAATEQADDRIELGLCESSQSLPLPPPSGQGASVDRDLVAFAVAPSSTKQVNIEPVATGCTITTDSGTQSISTDAGGRWVSATALQPGRYHVSCTAPGGYEPWPAKTRPSDGTVQVDEGRTTTAFFAFQRPAVPVHVNQGSIHYFRFQTCAPSGCIGPFLHSVFAPQFQQYSTNPLAVTVRPIPSPYGRLRLPAPVSGSDGVDVNLRPGLYGNTVVTGSNQYYLYVAHPTSDELGIDFGAPISWFYVDTAGHVTSGPDDAADSGLWMVRWYCHSGDNAIQLPCPEGAVPQGRGPLELGGAGGTGGT